MHTRALLIILFFLGKPAFLSAQTVFTDATLDAGINHTFRVFQGTFGGGVAVIDYDNDGFEDLFVAGGFGRDTFYKNMGDGTFQDYTEDAGLAENDTLITQGVVTADVNKDGYIDIFVTTIASFYRGNEIPRASDILYVNNGDGTFSDASYQYGFGEIQTFSTGAAFGDINADGYPDLYVGNYFDQFDGELDKINGGTITGAQKPSTDQLYINIQGKYFKRIDEIYGVKAEGFGFGGVFTDFDNDADMDLLVINDFGNRSAPNQLYRNNFPENTFTDVADELNVDFGMNAMGTAIGDYNQDGLLDYFITNIALSPFMHNQGAGKPFNQVSTLIGTGINSLFIPDGGVVAPVSWGTVLFDYDNDTDLDLFVANGALNPSIIPNPNLFFEYTGDAFEDKSEEYNMDDYGIARGAVTFDYDNDGDLDLFVVNQRPLGSATEVRTTKSKLYRNDTQNGNWLKVKLEGEKSTTRGLGSRVEAVIDGQKLIREIDGGSSHESQNSTIAHIGLGDATLVDSVVVQWVGGNRQVLTNVEANQTIVIEENTSAIESPYAHGKVSVFPSYFQNEIAIQYELPEYTPYQLEVVDEQGKRVAVLLENKRGYTGVYNWVISQDLTAGVYFFVIKTEKGRYQTRAVKL